MQFPRGKVLALSISLLAAVVGFVGVAWAAAENATAATEKTVAVAQPATVIWRWSDPRSVGGGATEVLGAVETVSDDAGRQALRFNGADTGLMISQIPHAGWRTFTVEMRIRPESKGPEEQRFLHFEDAAAQRGLLELRMTSETSWSLDAFLRTETSKVTLFDAKIRHPADHWAWVAMVYDGAQLRSYVNGAKELEGAVVFGPLAAGRTSVGVRQTLKSWFRGDISEVRFHPRALGAEELRRED